MAVLSGFLLFAAQTARAVRIDESKLLSGAVQTEGVIAGHKIHNFDAMFLEGREEFLRNTKHENEDREHFIIMLKDQLSQEQFDADTHKRPGVEIVGHKAGVPFIGFRGTKEELEALLLILGDDVLSVEADVPIGIPKGEEPLLKRNEDTHTKAASSECLLNHNMIGLSHRKYTGKGVHVYVFDTGIRASHNDFRDTSDVQRLSRVKEGYDIRCGSGRCWGHDCDEDNDATCNEDPHGHGTHVAGTAAGIRYGVAIDAHLISVKILDYNGAGSAEWAISGVDYVTRKGQKPGVLSMSIGSGRSTAFDTAVGITIDQGFTVVTASGNTNDDACNYSPGGIGRAINVGSVKWSKPEYSNRDITFETESDFSNFGRCVDILAPGEHIWSANAFDDDGVAMMDGTSMACPHVSGAAALILEQTPDLSPTEVWTAMEAGYVQLGAAKLTPKGTPLRRLKIGEQGVFCAQAFAPAFLPVALVLVVLQAFV